MRTTDTFTLDKGIFIGSQQHNHCRLKENTVGMLRECYQKSQQVVLVPVGTDNNGEPVLDPQLLCNPQLMSLESLRLRIDKLGDLDMPLDEDIFNRLSEKDLELMQQQADVLDGLAINRELADRGKSDSASAGAD